MKRGLVAVILICASLMLAGCGGGGDAPPTVVPATTVPGNAASSDAAATATLIVNAGGGRRAPTLAPTALPTEIPTNAPTATTMPSVTATNAPSATAAIAASNTPAAAAHTPSTSSATSVPALAPAVYVTNFSIDPAMPKSKPAEFLFHVVFLNTVGENVNYPRWRVLIRAEGQKQVIGDPQGKSKTIGMGATQQDTVPWSIKVNSVCEAFTAQPVWEDENGKQTPLPKPDGSSNQLNFQVCP